MKESLLSLKDPITIAYLNVAFMKSVTRGLIFGNFPFLCRDKHGPEIRRAVDGPASIPVGDAPDRSNPQYERPLGMRASHFPALAALAACVTLSACATTPPAPKDFSALTAERPRSILVVPALNNTVDVRAPDFFVSTISRPFAERGYYVFPANMVKRVLEEDGLADAGLVHSVDSRKVGAAFGCDTVLYVTIQRWDSKYVVLATQTTVKFDSKLQKVVLILLKLL
jgi:hypothetical protein